MKKKIFGDIFGGAISLTVSALLVKILGVIYKVPLSYVLTDVGMGYFNTAYTVYGFFYVLSTAGVPKAITCIISEAESKGRDGYDIYKISLRFFTIIGSIITVAYMIFSPLITKIISNSAALYTMLLIGPSILFVSTGGVCRGFLCAKGRLLPVAISQLIEAVCKLILGLSFALLARHLKLGLSVISAWAVLGITLGSLLGTLYMVIISKNEKNGQNAGQKNEVDRKELYKNILKIAAPITLSSSVLTIGGLIDMTVIMRCLEALGYSEESANEIYGNYTTLAVPMVNLVISLVTPLTVYLLPILIKARTSGNINEVRKSTERICALSMLFVCPCVVAFGLYGFDILDVLFTTVQAAKGYKLLIILSVGTLFLAALNLLNTVQEAYGRFNYPIITLSIGVVVKLIFEPLLVLYTPAGILGVPISTVLSYMLATFLSFILLPKENRKIPLFKYIFIGLCLSVLCLGLPYFTVFGSGIFGQNAISLIAMLTVGFAVYFVLVVLLMWLIRYLQRVKMNKKINV